MGNALNPMHAHHHRATRIQFSAAGALLLFCMAVGSLYVQRLPFLEPLLVTTGFARSSVTAEMRANEALQTAMARRTEALNAIVPAGAIPESAPAAVGVPVLLYHGFDDTSSTGSVLIDDFIAQMSALAQSGWHTVSIADFRDYLQGKKTLPEKSFLLTFDDGRKDSYYIADPVLEKTGFTAVMFVITAHMDDSVNPYYLRLRELRKMQASGRWELQSHGYADHEIEVVDANGTQGHFVSDALWLPDQQRNETDEEHRTRLHDDLVKAKQDLEQTFGVPVHAFAYPFGDYGQRSIERDGEAAALVLAETQKVYDLAFAQVDPGGIASDQNVPSADAFLAKRITVQPGWSADDLLRVLNAGAPKSFPYTAARTPEEWVTGWGSVTTADGVVRLSAKADGTGAQMLLKGSENVMNPTVSATVTPEKGESFSLVAAYRDDRNYVACDYTAHSITAREVVDGAEIQRRQWWSPRAFSAFVDPRSSVVVEIQASPNGLACLIHDDVAVGIPIPRTSSLTGSVGFKVWNSSLDSATLAVHAARIDSKF
jgi:peptidoglycan/xylan/chitin deacetylase (PgdA/CDA1 family)